MKIEELLYKLLMNELTPEEKEALEKMLAEKPEYQNAFRQFQERKDLKEAYRIYQKADVTSAWRKNNQLRHKNNRQHRIIKMTGIAASIAILFGISLFWIQREEPDVPVLIAKTSTRIPVSSGNIQVIVASDTYTIQDTTDLKERENALPTEEKELQIIVGQGNTFNFKLSDGTEVYMNAESKISYPGKFKGDTREIRISGEVYLNVTKDPKHPFLVHYGENNFIKVLGTSFNVKAYPDQAESFVTLVSGAIEFHSDKDSARLEPSQQLLFNKTTGNTSIQIVDPALYTAWMKDRFSFKYETLENISQELSRWYGVKFKFENHAQKRFSGGFSKYDNIEKILNLLAETTQINFSIQDSCIIVK